MKMTGWDEGVVLAPRVDQALTPYTMLHISGALDSAWQCKHFARGLTCKMLPPRLLQIWDDESILQNSSCVDDALDTWPSRLLLQRQPPSKVQETLGIEQPRPEPIRLCGRAKVVVVSAQLN